MSQPVFEGGMCKNFTSTTTITAPTAASSVIVGVFVAQATGSPTLKLADSVGTIANTFTPVAGNFYPMPFPFSGTLTITVGGTVDATIGWTTA